MIRDATLSAYSPRNVLKRVVELVLRAQGWEPVCGPRDEFFLVARNLDPPTRSKPMMGARAAPPAARQGLFMTAWTNRPRDRTDIYDSQEAQGFEIDGNHPRRAARAKRGRSNLIHGDPVRSGRRSVLFQTS